MSATQTRDWRSIRNATFIVSGLLGLAAASLLLMFLILEDIYGSWVLDQRVRTRRVEPVQRVGLIDANVRRLWSPKKAEEHINNWTLFLDGLGVEYRVLESDPAGGFVDIDDVDVLVVITPQGLTATERRIIQEKVADGTGAIFSVSSSMNEDEGILLHGGFWRELLQGGEPRVYEFERQGFVPFSGGLPFGEGIQPGEGIFFEKGMKAVTLSWPLRAALSVDDAKWAVGSALETAGKYDPSRPEGTGEFLVEAERAALPEPPRVERVEVRWGRFERGRWVVLGFDPSGVPPDSQSRETTSRLLVSAVRWVMNVPRVDVRPWPNGVRMAVMIAVDVVGRANPPAALETEVERLRVPVTYFYGIPSEESGRAENLIPPLGEVATRGMVRAAEAEAEEIVPFGGEEPDAGTAPPRPGIIPSQADSADAGVANGESRREEKVRDFVLELHRAREVLEPVMPRKNGDDGERILIQERVAGFMPPGEVYDSSTLAALAEADYDYMFSVLTVPIAVPVARRIELPYADFPIVRWWTRTERVVLVPRTVSDDLGLYLETGDATPQAVADRYVEEYRKFQDLEGLFTIVLHADFFEQPGAREAFHSLVERIQAPDVWFASASELSDWWLRREDVVVNLAKSPPHRLIVRLSNVGKHDAHGVVLRVQLPEPAASLSARLAHRRKTDYDNFDLRLLHGMQAVDLIVYKLAEGANETIYVDWR